MATINHDVLLSLVAAALDTCDDMTEDERDECFAEMCDALGVKNSPDEDECADAATGK
jgi:hypothetical protein